MKILLVNEMVRHPNVLPSLGLAILAAIAKRKGHQVKVIDYQITPQAPDLTTYVQHLTPDIVGVRIVNENWGTVAPKLAVIRPLVETIIVGGPYPTLHYHQLLTNPHIDYIITGEAEEFWTYFLEQYAALHRCAPRPKCIQQDHPSELVTLPDPDFTTFHHYAAIEYYPLQTSRGCPINCTFCMTNLINSVRWRKRGVYQVQAEVVQAIRIFPRLKGMVVIDDNPIHEPGRFAEFLSYYRGLYVMGAPPLAVLNVRADTITDEIAELLAECGCTSLILGVETIRPRPMQLIRKRITPPQILRAKKILNHAGIAVGGSFIIGLPGDDWAGVNRTIQFAQKVGLTDSLWGHLLPFLGTPVREMVHPLNDFAETMVAPRRGEIITHTGSETRELPEWWQIKGWLRANLKTNPRQSFASRWGLPQMLWHSVRYAEVHTFVREYGRWVAGKLNGGTKPRKWRRLKHG